MNRAFVCLIVSGMLCSACVGTKELMIRTQPKGADITINGEPQKERTPMVVEVSQKKDLGIVASMPGYESSAYTVNTTTNWWLSLLWTKDDPRARIIKENEVFIPMKKIPTAEAFRVSPLPAYEGVRPDAPKAPALRDLPKDL